MAELSYPLKIFGTLYFGAWGAYAVYNARSLFPTSYPTKIVRWYDPSQSEGKRLCEASVDIKGTIKGNIEYKPCKEIIPPIQNAFVYGKSLCGQDLENNWW